MIGYSLSLLVAAIIPHLSRENESPGFTKNKNETWISLSPSNLTELYFHHDHRSSQSSSIQLLVKLKEVKLL